MTGNWSTPATIAAKVRQRWTDGSLLRALASSEAFPTVDIPLRGPRERDLAEQFDAAQQWASALQTDAARCGYALQFGSVGGKELGRTSIPRRALIDSYQQAWKLLGVGRGVNAFQQVLELSGHHVGAYQWCLNHPLRVIELEDLWPRLLLALDWLEYNRGSGVYLRQISEPGVDTKFIERHLGVLAEILGVPAKRLAFEQALGFASKPVMVRFRLRPGTLGLPVSEATLRLSELNKLPGAISEALIIENEVTYLAAPVPPGGLVIWGKGYNVDHAGNIALLKDADVTYWGDIDTHGFSILSRLRSHLPQTRSVLMDRETLLRFRDRWGTEPKQHAGTLTHLTEAEEALYQELRGDVLGPRLRLEQERIDWGWALREWR